MRRFRFAQNTDNNNNNNNGWSCTQCTFQNDSNSIQCKICKTKCCKKRSIDELNNINKPRARKKQKRMNDMNDMEELYFPRNNKKEEKTEDGTLNIMKEFELEKPKIGRVATEYENDDIEYIANDGIDYIDDSNYELDVDFASHLSDDMYLYYSGEDIDALNFDGREYEDANLWELEKKFFEWKQIYKGCILFIENGYKYEIYDRDAIIISIALGVVASNKRGVLLKALLPEFKLDIYLRRLVEVGLMIAVINQTETGNTKNKKHKMINRELTGVFSKGTLFGPHISDITIDNDINTRFIDEFAENRYILCFHEVPLDNEFDIARRVEFNIVLIDLYSGIIFYDQFEDDFLRPKFLTILNHFNIVEIILPIQCISNNSRNLLANRYSKLGNKSAVRWTTHYLLRDFEYSECNTMLTEIYSNNSGEWLSNILEWDKSIIITFSMLVFYLRKCGLHQTIIHCKINSLQNKIYCNLNGITTKHLEIFNNTEGGINTTLFELMSRNNKTSFGRRLMHEWISRPLFNLKQIKLRQIAIKYILELYHDTTGRNEWIIEIIEKLSVSKDLERRLRIIQCKKCPPKLFLNTMKEFNEILNVLPIKNIINEFNKNGIDLLYSLFSSINRRKLLNIIDQFISKLNVNMTGYQDAMNDISEYQKLIECHKEINDAKQTLNILLNELRKICKNPKLEWKSVGNECYQIEIAKNKINEDNIPSSWKLNSETQTHLRYQPVEVEIAAITLAIHEEKMLFEAKRAWFHFLDDFNKISHVFCQFLSVLSQFDCLYSLAVLATNSNYSLPQFIDDNNQILQIKDGRHPTLEQYLLNNFIANDIDLSSDDMNGINQMVITGPNMGGKSVYIKMIGCLIIMSQIGSYVPAKSMKLTPFDMIGTRMGIYDDILQGKSTFFVEMSETSHLISIATNKSLLILDELGRGTSTFDGTAMAYSILKYIIDNIKCMTLFVTHYNDLLKVKNKYKCCDNYYMTYCISSDNTDNTVHFLYKLMKGECKESYGIQVAQSAGIKHDIIKKAKQCANNMKQYVINTTNNNNYNQKIQQFQSLLAKLDIS